MALSPDSLKSPHRHCRPSGIVAAGGLQYGCGTVLQTLDDIPQRLLFRELVLKDIITMHLNLSENRNRVLSSITIKDILI